MFAPIEAIVMPILKKIPLKQAQVWAAAYFRPMATYELHKKEAEISRVAVHFALAGAMLWLAAFIASLLSLNPLGALILLPGVIIYPIVLVISGFISSIAYFILAKILGGKGGFMQQTLAMALILGGYAVLAFPFSALSGIPIVGGILALAALLIGLYNLYNGYLVIKGVHQLSTLKAAAVVLIPLVILAVLAFVFAAIVAVSLIGAGLLSGGLGN